MGVLGVGLGACGSSGVEATVSTSDQAAVSSGVGATVSSGGEEEFAACRDAMFAGEDNAKALCTEAADFGNTDAMARLGKLAYDAGDLELAESWWQKAADLGNSTAMVGLGVLAYDAGDLDLAESWYQKSADLGNEFGVDALAALAMGVKPLGW